VGLAATMLVFTAFCAYRKLIAKSMPDKVMPLVDGFYQVTDVRSHDQVQRTLSEYFEVLEEVAAAFTEEEGVKLFAGFVIFISLVRTICYMSVHPRIGVLSNTMVRSFDSVFHFLIVFFTIFFVLVWLACWTIGPANDMFSSWGSAMVQCFQMLTGEFDFQDARVTPVNTQIWYLVYVGLVFILALNVFLAIIVEAFSDVKKRAKLQTPVERAIVVDLACLVALRACSWAMGWPQQEDLKLHMEITQDNQAPVTSAELATSRCLRFGGRAPREETEPLLRREDALKLMDFYLSIVGERLLPREGQEYLRGARQQELTQRRLLRYFGYRGEEVAAMVSSARRVQGVWRAHRQRMEAARRLARRGTSVSATQGYPSETSTLGKRATYNSDASTGRASRGVTWVLGDPKDAGESSRI